MDENTNKTRGTQTSVVETSALIIVIVVVGWFFVRPQMTVLKSAKSQLQQEQAEYQNVEKDKNDLNQLATKLKQSQIDLVLVDEALPLHNRPTQLEVLLDTLITATGMSATDLSLRQEEDSIAAGDKALLSNPYGANRKAQTTTVDLSVNGNIDQFKNLLQLIETNGRIIDVTGMSMINGSELTEFKLKLKAYNYVP